jgi:hypothetical protein
MPAAICARPTGAVYCFADALLDVSRIDVDHARLVHLLRASISTRGPVNMVSGSSEFVLNNELHEAFGLCLRHG